MISTVFIDNGTQAVRLPEEVRLPERIKRVDVRVLGNERIIAPLGQVWDSFFLNSPLPSDDFLPARATQAQGEREAF